MIITTKKYYSLVMDEFSFVFAKYKEEYFKIALGS